MHEFSVASQIADRVLQVAVEKKAKEIKSIELDIGQLNLLAEEQLKFWLTEILKEKEIAKTTKIKINRVKAVIKCRKCGYEGNLKSDEQNHLHPVFLCPSCKDSDIDIKEGRDCVIKKIKMQI
ncbi:MAG: hydrogenase/urease maturation nickel metallochaperone HypA [Candidatus Omnitrophota bacterium]